MVIFHSTVGSLVLLLNLLAAIWGGICWYRVNPTRSFWILMRSAQAVLVIQILVGTAMLLLAHKPAHLHLLYGLIPLGVSFIAEQLRASSTESILGARGVAAGSDVRQLPEREQSILVLAIKRREMAVMSVGAFVIFALALRAAQAAGLF